MINPFKEINWKPDEQEIKSFGKTILIGFSVISALIFLAGGYKSGFAGSFKISAFLIACGYFVFLLSIVSHRIVLPFYVFWFFVSALIGTVVSNTALLVFFYLFFSPFAIILRLLTGRDPLNLKKDAGSVTYWHKYKSAKDVKRYFRQY